MLKRPELFRGREFFYALGVFLLIFLFSLSYEYYSYQKFASDGNVTLTCKVTNQYIKHKFRDFYMLKLDCGEVNIYTAKPLKIGDVMEKNVRAEFDLSHLDFLGYLKGFYAKSRDFYAFEDESFKAKLNADIASQHENKEVATIYKALYTAAPEDLVLRQKVATLGLSHTVSISGFHLGLLSGVLFFLFGAFYRPIHSRYFPYRNSSRDLFLIVIIFLFTYVWFLSFIPPLLRSFGMLIVGYLLYDRGFKLLSMATLLLTILLLLAFFPRLLFSLSFWLSASGVFYIFLFSLYYEKINKVLFFFLFPIFVYLAMLPFSLTIFGIFSLVHPLSIVWDEIFILFYPLSILLHVSGFGGVLDPLLLKLLSLSDTQNSLHVSYFFLYLHLVLSLLAVKWRNFFYLLVFESFALFIYAIYYVA